MSRVPASGQIYPAMVRGPFGVTWGGGYTWEGGPVARLTGLLLPAHLPLTDLRVGHTFDLGPWRLRIIDVEYDLLRVTVMRDGGPARLRALRERIRRRAEWFTCRLILTAAVWGLADYDPALRPSWRDVHLLRAIAARLEAER